MTGQKENPYRVIWLLGAATMLPMVLAAGPAAGFLIGHYVLVMKFGMSSQWVLFLVLLGFAGSGLQTWRLIRRIKETEKK